MKSLLIDSTLCINCKACQVACKKWHVLPAEHNLAFPPELSGTQLTLVKDRAAELDGRLRLLFFKDQCRHCIRPRCAEACPLKAIEVEPDTGAVVITIQCDPGYCVNPDGSRPCEVACAYHIPKYDDHDYRDRKCDLCYDRINDGSDRGTSCADACPTGALYFGDSSDVRREAENRLSRSYLKFPNAIIYTNTYGLTRVMWLLIATPSAYGLP